MGKDHLMRYFFYVCRMLDLIIIVISIAGLLLGAHWLVDGASSIAKRLNISNLLIGLTVVSFGTSAPELVVNIIASISGSSDLAVGNILGSNTANILLILGVSSLFGVLFVGEKMVWREIPLALFSVILLAVFVGPAMLFKQDISNISRLEGAIFIFIMCVFLIYSFKNNAGNHGTEEEVKVKSLSVGISLVYFLLGLTLLVVGGKYVVDSGVSIARNFGVSESLIGITILAIGTSLPELATSVIAVMKKNTDIAIGNVVGSNIFNVFFVLGITSLLNPIPFSQAMHLDMWMAIVSSLLLFLFLFVGKRHQIGSIKGAFFILIYIAYLSFQVYKNINA